jgi:GNAT superfamily N-acetyltransferase
VGDDESVTVHDATQNAAAMWTAVGRARGYELVRGHGYLLIDDERLGLRCLLLSADPGDLGTLNRRIQARAGGPVMVEDPFGTVDLTGIGLSPRQLPVMGRRAGRPEPPDLDVVRVETPERLRVAERTIVDGFPLEQFAPYRPGEAFPSAMLDETGAAFFIAERDGVPVGACLTLDDGVVCGFYWVTTRPAFRSTGVGRALMNGALAHVPPRPVTLTASRAGRPLYESMAFDHLGSSTWWSR